MYKKDNSYITEGIVIDIKKEEDYNKIVITKGINKAIIYDKNKSDIEISDKIIVTGESKELTKQRLENGFNQKQYYYGIRVNQVISSSDIIIKDVPIILKIFNIFNLRKILYKYLDYFFQNDISKSYIKALVIGDSSELYEEDLENIKINGISHLFAISGLHISLLVSLLTNMLLYFKLKDEKVKKIITIVLCCYMIITNLNVSICRASLLYIISNINKKNHLKLSSLDIISILFIFFIIINPSYLYNLSFQLSFLASFFIILFSNVLKIIKEEYKIRNVTEIMILTFFVQIITLPISTNLNNSFNFTSFIINVLFIVFVTYIILPFTFLTFTFPILQYIYQFVIVAFNYVNELCSKYISLSITLPSFNKIELVCYYVFLILICIVIKRKTFEKVVVMIVFSLFLFLYYEKINLNSNGEVNFLDLHEGDSIVINLPLNEGLIVIDTGVGKNNELSKYLKSIGVRQIDALIITHNHLDHNGEAKKIINDFKVHKIILSAYDDSVIKATSYVKAGDTFNVLNYTFRVLSPSEKSEETNDNSLVLLTRLGNYDYLFLGDASKKIEESIIKNYKINCDVIKVGHHGSSTSTSAELYENIKPKIAIIETGQVEYYGFPNKRVIEQLLTYSNEWKMELYRTDLNHSIKIKFNKKESIIYSMK